MTLDSKPGKQVQFADTLKLTELDGQVKQAVLPTSGANDQQQTRVPALRVPRTPSLAAEARH